MSSRKLDDLSPKMKPLAIELIARAIEAGIQVRIIETTRTSAEQQQNIANGVSWTMHSKHLTGDAIDLAPVAVLNLKNWAPAHPDWKRLADIAVTLGLEPGYYWTKHPDNPHFQLPDETMVVKEGGSNVNA